MTKSNTSMHVSCERDGTRRIVPRTDTAWIDVRNSDGRTWSLPVLDISRKGLSFGVDGTELDGRVDAGDRFEGVAIHVEGRRFEGTVRVVHVTEGFATGTVCGCTFTPDAASEGPFRDWTREWLGG